MSPTTSDNEKAVLLTWKAHVAELKACYDEARDLQTEAAKLLVKVVANGQKQSKERRFAKLQLGAANERISLLRAYAKRGSARPPQPLPSLLTITRELTHPTPGTILLTAVHTGERSILADASGLQPEREDASSQTLLSELLSPSLPLVTYHVYPELVSRFPGRWILLHIKDAEKSQVLYTLHAQGGARGDLSECVMSRASEFHMTCAEMEFSAVASRKHGQKSHEVGRPLKIVTEAMIPLEEHPDQLEGDWTPRRFSYGGRRFVWKKGKGSTNTVETLYEVVREWPDPWGQAGELLDEIYPRPLAWGASEASHHKLCYLQMVGGLDQRFREYILASQTTRQLIARFG